MSDRIQYFASRRPTGTSYNHRAPQPFTPGSSSRELRGLQGQGSRRYVRGSYTLLPGYNIHQINGLLANDDRSGFLLAIPPETPLPGYSTARISSMNAAAPEAEPSPARAATITTARVAGNATTVTDLELAREAQEIEIAIRNSLMDNRHPAVNVLHDQVYHGNTPADRAIASSHPAQPQQGLHSAWRLHNENREGYITRNQQNAESWPAMLRSSTRMVTCTLCNGSRAVQQDAAIADGMPVCEKCCDEMMQAEQSRAERSEREASSLYLTLL
ncbi:hypothetical protein MferCBS31731_002337 [Microsporum ferrugineum]